jgi:hypothetical protein
MPTSIPGYSLQAEAALRLAIAAGLNSNTPLFIETVSKSSLELCWSVCGIASRVLTGGIPSDEGAEMIGAMGRSECGTWFGGPHLTQDLFAGVVATSTRGAEREVVKRAVPSAIMLVATLTTVGIMRNWTGEHDRAVVLDNVLTSARVMD